MKVKPINYKSHRVKMTIIEDIFTFSEKFSIRCPLFSVNLLR